MEEDEPWEYWAWNPPVGDDRDKEIEFKRGFDGNVERLIPNKLSPEFNIADCYWRHIR